MHRIACLMVLVCGGGVAKEPASGIDQFWTDDYKVFDHVYGKTSDKELFGATLPPSISFSIDAAQQKKEASEKKERYLESYHNTDLDIDQSDPYAYGAKYPGLFNNQGLQKLALKKPSKNPPKFIPSDFKPIISQESDPETYNYLKHLEILEKQKEQYSQINLNGFKPFLNYGGGKAVDSDAYKSIQDILEAHEANKGKNKDNDPIDDQVKYLTYGGDNRGHGKKVKPRPVPAKGQPGKSNPGKGSLGKGIPGKGKPPCTSGRCRKRATTTYRGRTYLTRPYVRKIKHKIINY